jgi:hypothetical protein
VNNLLVNNLRINKSPGKALKGISAISVQPPFPRNLGKAGKF